MKIKLLSNNQEYIIEKVGVFTPKPVDVNELNSGEIGFIIIELNLYQEQKLVTQYVMPQILSKNLCQDLNQVNPWSSADFFL